jgi:hypothetical protein
MDKAARAMTETHSTRSGQYRAQPSGYRAFIPAPLPPLPPLIREVLPYAADAWFDRAIVRIGYKMNLTRYFYTPNPLGLLEEIRADSLALDEETKGLPGDIVGAHR